ncbi:MAG: ATP-binding region, ATPase-like [uncultured Rubrobacteraceae bacterium]|uniref:ATP-binding region, ATPase-like n=1 Tax=uncultured Rubrobacteraceae bacterium TaxID=349277 RepID=A0A6J4T193_9ACTN|nr:MAG: ATP-binding region, ATPase-like [uncultured Rubrobacteraceae bacterium]
MSGRAAWGLWALTALAVAPTLLLASLNVPSSARNSAVVALVILAFSTVGALVASRRPGNPIGWLFLAGASFWILGELALEYAVYALVTAPGTLPAGAWAGWFGGWARGMGWLIIALFLLLLFPTGRLPSPRWRPVLWGTVLFCLFFTALIWLAPASSDLRLTFVTNPMGLELPIMDLLMEVLYFALPLTLLVSGAAVIVRFRRSRGDERQQIKWFAYAVAVMVSLFLFWFSLALTGLVPPDALLWTVPLLGLPAGVGVSVLRYRLYDIDRIINRTLVYGALTLMLASLYFGGVVVIQYALRATTGQESSLAVVASTLAIAALFGPLRRRIQGLIDRAFYRGKYDAGRVLGAYASRVRDETDLASLGDGLAGVVAATLRPAHVSLWLREPAGGTKEGTSYNGDATREHGPEAGPRIGGGEP